MADKINKQIWKYSTVAIGKTLTIDKNGTGTGTAECEFNNGGSFGACTSPQPDGTVVKVKATANGGSELTALSGNGSATGNCTLGTGTCSFTINADTTVTATFEQQPPTVTTIAGATEITQTTAKVAGTVNPNGGNVTACKVEYGPTNAYGSEANCASLPGSGNSPVAVEKGLTGLSANTTYHFRFAATNAGGTGQGSDQTFTTQVNAPTVTTTAGATEITQTTAKVAGTVNPNGGNVTACKVEYGPTNAYGSEANCASLPGSGNSPVAVEKGLTGLSANTTYHFRFAATNAGGTGQGSDQTFTTAVNAPTVVTQAANPVSKTTATLNGTVNPNGGEVTNCHFDYGPTNAYGSTVPCVPANPTGSSSVGVSAEVTGLSASSTYHFRLVATNAGGTNNGSDEEFTTSALSKPSVITTPGATEITQTTAKVAGTVNPNGLNVTACKVEYGPTNAYGSEAACASLPGSGTSPVPVSKALSGLEVNKTYHFRFVATNSDGTSEGSDQTFTTLPNAPTVTTTAGATAIAQTTATVAGTVNPNGGNVTACKVEYGPTNAYGSEANCASLPGSGNSPVAVEKGLTALTANTTYHFRFVATNAGGSGQGSDQTFTTQVNAPTVTAPSASEITQTSMKLNATVNPNEANVSTCSFEYGLTTSYGQSAPCVPANPGSGSSAVAVSASISGLTANTTYHFRLKATNAGGTNNSSDASAATLVNAPTVTPPSASEITQTAMKLSATVNPNSGNVSTCSFEYGLTTSYGQSAPCVPANPGSGSSAVAVSASISGLTANTTYHFRLKATNAGGTNNSSDASAATLVNAPTVTTTAGATEITQTTAKVAGTVNPNGGNVTACKVEYGPTNAYGSEDNCASLPGSGNSPVAVEKGLTSLSASTTYHFRFVATNVGGTTNGSDQTFTTLIATKQLIVAKGGTGTGTVTSSPPGVSCGATCSASFNENTIVTLTGAAGPNSKAVVWTSGCDSINGSNQCVVTMSAAKEVVATFNLQQQTLTIGKGGTGAGTVASSAGGLDCGSICGPATFNKGASATLTASPSSGSSFAGWSGGGCSGTGACVVTLNSDTTVTAIFDANDGAAPPPPPPAPSNVAIPGTAKQRGEEIALKVSVPGPGSLVATGKNMVKTKGNAKGAGVVTLKLKLTSAGKRQLQKKGKVKVKVKIVFTPAGGSPGTSTKTVTFKTKRGD